MKKIYTTILLLTTISFSVIGQTNVSGGIYTNTTWTLANSPYIVIDTVVVFPGVTLTIQPGVTVKFENNKRLEIRQAKLIALGTMTDSITFTSNNPSPSPEIWETVFINGGNLISTFNYCNFKYAQCGLACIINDSLIIDNSNFNYNDIGVSILLYGYAKVSNSNFIFNTTGITTPWDYEYCKIISCTFKNNVTGISGGGLEIDNSNVSNNQTGADIGGQKVTLKNSIIDSNNVTGIISQGGVGAGSVDSIINCEIKYNGIGLYDDYGQTFNFISKNSIEYNNIGIKVQGMYNDISCNKVCNNTSYDFYYYANSSNYDVSNNYWCSSDSATIASHIYDGYDNISLGLVNFIPFDTLLCYLTTNIQDNILQTFQFAIFPNPVSDNLTIEIPINVSTTGIKIFNLLGELEYSSTTTGQKTDIDVSTWTNGMYIIQIASGDKISRQKFIKN